MAKTVAELQKEAKEKLEKQKQSSEGKDDPQKKASEMEAKVAFLEAQTKALQEQLDKRLTGEEEEKLEKQAEALRRQEEALRQEADIARIMDEALRSDKKSEDEDAESMSQKELASVIAETVGKALDASSKLTMNEVDKKIQELSKQNAGLQKVMIELLSGMSVERARNQFEDFDKYREEASKIHRSHPTLTPTQAYHLAKAQAESTQPDKDRLETEKPNEPPVWSPDAPFSTSRSSALREDEDQPVEDSRRRFRREISEAVDAVLARRKK